MATILSQPQWINSLDPGICGFKLKVAIFKLISRIDISCKISLRWMPQDLIDDEWRLVGNKSLAENKPGPEPMLTKFYDVIRND